jgi:hypothetical protein
MVLEIVAHEVARTSRRPDPACVEGTRQRQVR